MYFIHNRTQVSQFVSGISQGQHQREEERSICNRICACIKNCFYPQTLDPFDNNYEDKGETALLESGGWRQRTLSVAETRVKMKKNAHKAVREHFSQAERENFSYGRRMPNPYASAQQAGLTDPDFDAVITCNFSYAHSIAEDQGPRKSMEDAHFFEETDGYILTGIFDGHGGTGVANYANEHFVEKFHTFYDASEDNVHYAFEKAFQSIQDEIEGRVTQWEQRTSNRYLCGSTAICCFIHKHKGEITTATIADSEANIYRNCRGNLKSIALSCVRHWGHPKEAKRASVAMNKPSIENEWTAEGIDHKLLRFAGTVNISRSLGNIYLKGTPDKPGVIQKPKISLQKLKSGDRIVICCDGLKDYLKEIEIIDILSTSLHKNRAQHLVDSALDSMVRQRQNGDSTAGDNLTVIYIAIN